MDQLLTTSVLLIDGSKNQRSYWAEQLKHCSPDYVIVEASDGQSGLDLYRSQRIDCVVLELGLPDRSGFEVLMTLVPNVSRPQVAVIVLTQIPYRAVWELAKENGAYACFHKNFTTGADLDKAIQRAVGFVGQMPKEYRYQPGRSPSQGPTNEGGCLKIDEELDLVTRQITMELREALVTLRSDSRPRPR